MKRFWEVDAARGIAVIAMIVYHIMMDLSFFGPAQNLLNKGSWFWFSRGIGTSFLLIVGVSLTLSYSRNKEFMHFLKRGGKIFGIGLVITFLVRFSLGGFFVVFGALHLIGFSIIAAYPFLKYKYISLATGIITLIIGIWLYTKTFNFLWLTWLGFLPQGYLYLDHYTVLPWIGFVLIGVFLGDILYKNHKRQFKLKETKNPVINAVEFFGRHSLIIYLAMQPIILLVLQLFGLIQFI